MNLDFLCVWSKYKTRHRSYDALCKARWVECKATWVESEVGQDSRETNPGRSVELLGLDRLSAWLARRLIRICGWSQIYGASFKIEQPFWSFLDINNNRTPWSISISIFWTTSTYKINSVQSSDLLVYSSTKVTQPPTISWKKKTTH